MATSCEDNNWIWDYFTSENNKATCDICKTSYKIIRIPKNCIMNHIKTTHSVDYQRIVSSENSQKDIKSQLYIMQNHNIKCNFCNKICTATNNLYSIRNHLEKKHKIKKEKAAEISELLRIYYFDEYDTDVKRRCITCNEIILNKNFILMNHLSKTHQVNVPLDSKSMGYLISNNWMWEYFTTEEEYVKCSICDYVYNARKNITIIKNHIKKEHDNTYDISENSQENRNWSYSITENNQIKCNICDNTFDLTFRLTSNMKNHLIEKHNLNENIARNLCTRVFEYFHISNLHISKCNMCENVFQKSNAFNLIIHLKEAHKIWISPEIIPARLSSRLSNLFNSDRYTQNITSSRSQQPICSYDQSSDCDNFYDQIDESSEIKTTRLLSSSSRLLNSGRNAEDIATSSSYQQPTLSFDFDNVNDQQPTLSFDFDNVNDQQPTLSFDFDNINN